MENQLEIPERISTALMEKSATIVKNLQKYSLDQKTIQVLIVAYKDNNKLELYAKNRKDHQYQLIQSYKIAGRSGNLGPKKAEGDKQTPEGFYFIDRFNPKSKYYLSLGLNYPNELDQNLEYTGSNIFIHGGTESQGCLAMTDDSIKEIYLYALFAKNAGQEKIPVYIFPFEMNNENIEKRQNQIDRKTLAFWKNIQKGYLFFLTTKQEIIFLVENQQYIFHK